MNVFADLHNDGLYRSLWFIFEKRLGGTLYRPIGYDWYHEGFWKYNEKHEVVKQYLQFNANGEDRYLGDHWDCWETKHAYYHHALTFQQFLKKDIDIVIASVTSHEEPYHRLVAVYKPHAKMIRQAGNIHDTVNFDFCKNVLASTYLFDANTLSNFDPAWSPPGINVVTYHQEFDLANYSFEPPSDRLRITNFMNCYPDSRDAALWHPYRGALSEFDWRMHGILGADGIIGTDVEMAKAFHNTTFVWHLKFGGDGFGAVIHQAFATGRPPIVKRSYYADKMAGELMIDADTCIDLEVANFSRNIESIRYWSKPKNYEYMSRAAHEKFCKIVNYDEEAEKIRKFLEQLQ